MNSINNNYHIEQIQGPKGQTRLGIYQKKSNEGDKLIHSIACEVLPKNESFLSSVKHFFMRLSKKWIKIPNTEILINTNSLVNKLGITKQQAKDIKGTDDLQKFAQEALIIKCKKNEIIYQIDKIGGFISELETNAKLRYDPKKKEIKLFSEGDKPYLNRAELAGTYLFTDVSVHYDAKEKKHYIDLGDLKDLYYIVQRDWEDNVLYTKTAEKTDEEKSTIEKEVLDLLKISPDIKSK